MSFEIMDENASYFRRQAGTMSEKMFLATFLLTGCFILAYFSSSHILWIRSGIKIKLEFRYNELFTRSGPRAKKKVCTVEEPKMEKSYRTCFPLRPAGGPAARHSLLPLPAVTITKVHEFIAGLVRAGKKR